ncbi:hypothetical protein D9M69_570830 [compost metagenome]
MPVFAGIAQPHRLAILHDVGHDEDLRIPGQVELMQHVDHQAAEAPAEIDVLLRGNALVAEHQQVVVQMRLVHPGEVSRVEFLRQIDTDDLRAHRARQGPDQEILGRGNGGVPRCRIRFGPAQRVALGHGSLLAVTRRPGRHWSDPL